jgi:hypothetical protein
MPILAYKTFTYPRNQNVDAGIGNRVLCCIFICLVVNNWCMRVYMRAFILPVTQYIGTPPCLPIGRLMNGAREHVITPTQFISRRNRRNSQHHSSVGPRSSTMYLMHASRSTLFLYLRLIFYMSPYLSLSLHI